MIRFRKVRYKNFLSTGNMWIEVQLDRSPSTMITGKNGHGKSSVLDALTFALFGKPFRKINKPQLVNTKANKDLMVELEFDIGQDEYQIRRGQKPEILEVKKNGQLMNQPGDSRDFQKTLNMSILKMDYAAFTQIVAVGKAQHVSFMKLDAAKRRAFIETILSLVIFSKMTQLQNQKVSAHKEKTNEIKTAITVAGEKVKVREKYIADLEQEYKSAEEASKAQSWQQIEDLKKEIENARAEIEKIMQETAPGVWQDEDRILINLTEARGLQTRFEQKLEDLLAEIQTLNETTVCSHCEQDISAEKRAHMCEVIKTRADSFPEKIQTLKAKAASLEERRRVIQESNRKNSEAQNEIHNLRAKIRDREERIEKLQSESSFNADGYEAKIKEAKQQLSKLVDVYEKLQKKRANMTEDSEYMNLVTDMLKDSGIKGMLIKRYIPVINHAINNNLAKLGFFGKFSLDEEFEETIQARGFDTLSYNNFSEGEKMRIDMAVLLAWREIAKLQSNVDTNLLLLDEVVDGSLDTEGTEAFSRLLTELKGTNLFIVTHSPEKIADKMRSHIHFEKVGGYSAIVGA